MNESALLHAQEAIEFKASFQNVIQLLIKVNHLEQIRLALMHKLQLSAQLLQGQPIVLDFSRLNKVEMDFGELKNLLAEFQLPVAGIRHLESDKLASAMAAGFLILADQKKAEPKPEKKNAPSPAKIIHKPIRSGQQIYAQNSDLIITANVGEGAEVLADGHIHIYGSLRGRALAGCNGNLDARIFCLKFEAELVAIAGHYTSFEEMIHQKNNAACEIYFDGQRLQCRIL